MAFFFRQADGTLRSWHEVLALSAVGVPLFGALALLGVYQWVAYYRERVAVAGTTIFLQTVFHQFGCEVAQLDRLVWRYTPLGGQIKFRAADRHAKIDLHGYDQADRLRMIRTFHNLLPLERQEGWPLFCHKQALPLRKRLLPAVPEPLGPAKS